MTEDRVSCIHCDNQILPQTAARNGGLCGVCQRNKKKSIAKSKLDADIQLIRYVEEFEKLRSMTRMVVRSAFLDLARHCVNEQIYGLCIYAQHSVGPPVLCGSTLSEFAKREALLRANTSLQQMLPNMPIQELVFTSGKWSPYEWEYEAYRWEDFRGIADYLEAVKERVEVNPRNELHSMVLAAYVATLHDLDREGLFDQHRESSSLVLFCSDRESSDREWYENASARFLNPTAIFDSFFNESVVYGMAEEQHNRELFGDERQRRFSEYLRLIEKT